MLCAKCAACTGVKKYPPANVGSVTRVNHGRHWLRIRMFVDHTWAVWAGLLLPATVKHTMEVEIVRIRNTVVCTFLCYCYFVSCCVYHVRVFVAILSHLMLFPLPYLISILNFLNDPGGDKVSMFTHSDTCPYKPLRNVKWPSGVSKDIHVIFFMTVLFSKFANHQRSHQSTSKMGCQSSDYSLPLKSSSRICVGIVTG